MKLVDTIPKLVSLMLTLGKIQPIPLMLLYFSLKMFWPADLNLEKFLLGTVSH